MPDLNSNPTLPRDLGGELRLRRGRAEDADKLAAFNARIHSDAPGQDDLDIAALTRDLLSGNHPTFRPDDFTIIENTRTGEIVSSANLISQTWTYAGIPFGVGRPELVGTDPNYRRRGLVRIQMETLHEWSRQRGEVVQAITGIPFYYRQFGYEMAVDLDGGRRGSPADIPALPKDQSEPYLVRPALEADLPFIAGLYAASFERTLLNCLRTDALWRSELLGKDPRNADRRDLRVITRPDGELVGFLTHPFVTYSGPVMIANALELKPGVSWAEVLPSVFRYLWTAGKQLAAQKQEEVKGFGLYLDQLHPAYSVAEKVLTQKRDPYAWYLRVPDLIGFLRRITPVLERRLEQSYLSGHTGEIRISFYRSGLELAFERGKLTRLDPWQPMPEAWGHAAFPDLTFTQLLFGYRDIAELEYAFADCWVREAYRPLLTALFPKQPSNIWPVA